MPCRRGGHSCRAGSACPRISAWSRLTGNQDEISALGARPGRKHGFVRLLLIFLAVFILLANVPVKKFIASTRSEKYHRLECTYAQRIEKRYRVYFFSRGETEMLNYRPCRYCSPGAGRQK